MCILKQIEERQEERMQQDELKDQERQQMLKDLERLQMDELEVWDQKSLKPVQLSVSLHM